MQSVNKRIDEIKKQENMRYICLPTYVHICEMVRHAYRKALEWFGDLLLNLACKTMPSKYGKDIEQLKFKNLELLTNDPLIQEHFFKFYKRMEVVLDPKNARDTVEFFKANVHKYYRDLVLIPVAYALANKSEMLDVTLEEENLLTRLCKPHEYRNLSFRDAKLYYNICVKCIDFSVQNDNFRWVSFMSGGLQLFEKYSTSDTLQIDHQKFLKSSRFIRFLENMKKKYGKKRFSREPSNKRIPKIIDNLIIENILYGSSVDGSKTTYEDISLLLLEANKIHRYLDKYKFHPFLDKCICVLILGKGIGIIDPNLFDGKGLRMIDHGPCDDLVAKKVNKIKVANGNVDLSEQWLKNIITTQGINIDEIKEQLEEFVCVINDEIGPIGVNIVTLIVETT